MSPDRMLAEMIDVYASAGSYRDTGRVVASNIVPGGGRWRDRVQLFKTAFVRPDRIRSESWHLHGDGRRFGHRVTWGRERGIRLWSQTRAGVESARDLDWALTLTLGLVGRAPLAVLRLLHPDTAGMSWLTNLVDVSRLDDQVLEEIPCFRLICRCGWWDVKLTGEEQQSVEDFFAAVDPVPTPPGPTRHLPISLWLDQRTLLVRRIDEWKLQEKYRTETVTTFQPEIRDAISDEELSFDPSGPS